MTSFINSNVVTVLPEYLFSNLPSFVVLGYFQMSQERS